MAKTIGIASWSSSLLIHQKITYQLLNGNGSIFARRFIHCCGILHCNRTYASVADKKSDTVQPHRSVQNKSEKASKAIQSYLERLQKHDALLGEHVAEYEIGKRHLANMMGEDPEDFTQTDIDNAISYLLPSALYDKKARPVMKHPLQILPIQETPQFGMDGRPFNFMFYTGKPRFFELMHTISCKLDDLKASTDSMKHSYAYGNITDKKTFLNDTEWHSKEEIEKKVFEKISDNHYRQFIALFDHLVNHPLSFKEDTFIMEYRKKLQIQQAIQAIKAPLVDSDGREFVEATGKRKTAFAHVKLWGKGNGQFTINNRDLFYFEQPIHRQQVLFPLQFVNKLGEFDVVAAVQKGGPTGQSGALRLALSMALTSFVGRDMVEKMRLAGLLTLDPRRRERKKPGQEGARKKFTWKKR